MNTRWFALISSALLALSIGATGCAKEEDDAVGPAAESEVQARVQLDDNQLQGKLRGILEGVTFISEGDYGYKVFEGEAVPGGARLSKAIIREKLSAAIKTHSEDHRDIQPAAVRAERLNVSQVIADGDGVEVPTDPEDDNYIYAHHDRQLTIALKTMRSQLRGVVGFTFGTSESGDGDGEGNVLYVYVGISKTSGKLIAIMTEAVYT